MKPPRSKSPGFVIATVLSGRDAGAEVRFSEDFVVGNAPDCDLSVPNLAVGDRHLQVFFDGVQWWARDLASEGGTWANGSRVQVIPLSQPVELELGKGGPRARFEVAKELSLPGPVAAKSSAKAATKPATKSVAKVAAKVVATDTQMIEDFFEKTSAGAAPGTTGTPAAASVEVLEALRRVRRKSRRNRKLIPIIVGLVVLGAGFIGYGEWRLRQQEKRLAALQNAAENIFYNAKTLEVQIANLDELVAKTSTPAQIAELQASRANLKDMEAHYDDFVQKLGLYVHLAPDERIIRRMARRFGDCDVNVPPDFVAAVRRQIALIKTREFFPRALAKAKQKYGAVVAEEFVKNHLPPHFLYLALQESGFDERAVGPGTRYGYAKGMWQFISSTAHDYGLRTGPLFEQDAYDPKDERFDWRKETAAAARYIRSLNANVTQESGLLSMACYNWGEGNVRPLVDSLPANAQERNFWVVLRAKGVPAETYDYVLSIFSMAVICEDPQLFGFNVECPVLAGAAEPDPMAGQ